VKVTSNSGKLEAPHVTYSSATGLLHAVDGVRAELAEKTTGVSGPLGVGGTTEPVRVEANEAFLRGEPESFLFRGTVRAWQGNNLLLAEQLRGEGGERMSASGEVKTIWRPRPSSGEAGEGREADPEPVEITSQHMSYARSDGVLLYNENVKAEQAGRVLSCAEMAVELGEDNEAERLQCKGQARLVDPPTGRTIRGTEAIYHLEPGEVEFFGDPLMLRDPQRGRIEARRLRYRLEDGQMWMGAAAESPQPTG
jgi:lipopolysaccharide export system protein LptA